MSHELEQMSLQRGPWEDEEGGRNSLNVSNDSGGSGGSGGSGAEVEFTEKLERLVAMRLRHYEKERILERARDQRRSERKKRDLQLRRHEIELHLEEIEASLTPRSHDDGGSPVAFSALGVARAEAKTWRRSVK